MYHSWTIETCFSKVVTTCTIKLAWGANTIYNVCFIWCKKQALFDWNWSGLVPIIIANLQRSSFRFWAICTLKKKSNLSTVIPIPFTIYLVCLKSAFHKNNSKPVMNTSDVTENKLFSFTHFHYLVCTVLGKYGESVKSIYVRNLRQHCYEEVGEIGTV